MSATRRRPPALRPGDRVALLSVSGRIRPDRLDAAVADLRAAGLDPVVSASARADSGSPDYLAGPDELRAADLSAALLDDAIRAVFCGRGGYGAQRVLERLDWSRFAGVAPKAVVGYSDVTALHEALAVELGWVSLHGPLVASNTAPDPCTGGSLLRALMSPERATRLDFPGARAVVGGSATGVVLGGNLAMLVSSLGTPSSLPARGGLLLLEDVGEDAYRVDRMLTQLRRSNYLDGVAGILGGSWLDCEGAEAVLVERLGGLGVPLLLGADVGHAGRNQTVPLGVEATLDADAATLTYAEPPLVPTA